MYLQFKTPKIKSDICRPCCRLGRSQSVAGCVDVTNELLCMFVA
jgi:hypothetical protein